jgi:crossover junction endodeoxyribonuclease RuvC
LEPAILGFRLAGMGEVPRDLRILGVDPAAAGPTGYAVIERSASGCSVLHYGALKVAAKRLKASPAAALHDVYSLLCELIRQFQPNVLAVESVFTALNMRTALRLAEVRGVVLLAAEQHGLKVRSYSPREIKASVAGYGHADKRQMQVMVRAQLGLKEIPEPPDAADALAVALCHLQAEELEQRFGVRKADLSGNGKTRKSFVPVAGSRTQVHPTRNLRIPPVR